MLTYKLLIPLHKFLSEHFYDAYPFIPVLHKILVVYGLLPLP